MLKIQYMYSAKVAHYLSTDEKMNQIGQWCGLQIFSSEPLH